MHSDPSSQSPGPGLHIPFTLLSLAVVFFLLLQSGNIQQGMDSMNVQLNLLKKRTQNTKESGERLEKSIAERKVMVDQSELTQKQFTDVMADLVELAKSDEDAKAIVETYGIRLTPNGPAAEGAEKTN